VIAGISSSSDFFHRSIANLSRQLTANLSIADAVEDTSGSGVGCFPPVASSALSDLSITGLTTGRKRKYKYESADSAQNDSFIPQKFGQSLSVLRQVRTTK
jgi:hypothetical protein